MTDVVLQDEPDMVISAMDAVFVTSFNTTMGQMTKMSQRKEIDLW